MRFIFALALIAAMFCLTGNIYAQPGDAPFLEEAKSFFPDWKELNQQDIEWKRLVVPENWETRTGTVKLGVAIIKSNAENSKKAPIIYLQGGPGGGAIYAIWRWVMHPLRNDRDIILVDLRGTGFSEPSLCPELGKEFLKILAADITPQEEILQRNQAAMVCKEDLLKRKIDITGYNSSSMAKDLHALHNALKLKEWSVYGTSYGTRVALAYMKEFPGDVENMILDSPVPPNGKYYENNTSNYFKALNVLFDKCANDPRCKLAFGDLSHTYEQTIERLRKNPIRVSVSKSIVPTSEFVMNADDMMMAVQQGLYDRKLFEVLPMMISEFQKGNTDMTAALVSALSSRLSLDYGTYYCVLCSENIPFNSIEAYEKDGEPYKALTSGLPFYKAEFSICENWNTKIVDSIATNSPVFSEKPTLILSGEFDPITPPSNGKLTAETLSNSQYLLIKDYGHGPGFSACGGNLITSFLNDSKTKQDLSCFEEQTLHFATNVKMNGGVFKFANSIVKPNWLLVSPLLVALIIIILFLIILLVKVGIGLIKRNLVLTPTHWILYSLMGFIAVVGLFTLVGLAMAIQQVSVENFYILAFGLPDALASILWLPYIFSGLTFVLVVLLYKWNGVFGRSLNKYFFLVTSCFLILVLYFFYWNLY